MIPKKYTSDQLRGRKCRTLVDIKNGGGNAISAGTICTIVTAHYGVEIKTDKCPVCGQYCYISRIDRSKLELVEESDEADSLEKEKQ